MRWWRMLAIAAGLGCFAVAAMLLLSNGPSGLETSEERAVTIATMPCANRVQAKSSGFVIDDRTVVTVAHALFESRDLAVRDSTGIWHEASIQHLDRDRDLALLRVETLRSSPVATRVGTVGQGVTMVSGAASGTAQGDVIRRVRLTIEAVGDLDRESQRSGYELSVSIAAGDSGAAVVDPDDNLLGVIFAKPKARDTAWATSVTEIEAIQGRTSVPDWECRADVDAQLILEPLEPPKPNGPVVN